MAAAAASSLFRRVSPMGPNADSVPTRRSPTPSVDENSPPPIPVLGGLLGTGATGQVRLHFIDGGPCVIKEAITGNLKRECEILNLAQGDGVVTLLGVRDGSPVMEWAPHGDLAKHIKAGNAVRPTALKAAAVALERLHRIGIYHRDVKPQNLLVCSVEGGDGGVKLKWCDFDSGAHLPDGQYRREQRMIGSPQYIAPEVIKARSGEMISAGPAEVWSFGVMTYFAVTGGKYPHQGEGDDALFPFPYMSRVGGGTSPNLVPIESLGPNAIDFFTKTLCHNPLERLKMDELIAHPFLKEG